MSKEKNKNSLVGLAFVFIVFVLTVYMIYIMSVQLTSKIKNDEEAKKIYLIIDKSNVFINAGTNEVVDTKRAFELGSYIC